MKKWIKFLVLVAIVTGVVACGGNKENEKGKESADKKSNVGVTVYKYDDNFMATVRKKMEEVGKEKNVNLSIVDSQNSQSTQNEQIDVFLSKGVNVLAINLVDPAAGQTVVDKIKAQNIPVIFYNKDPGVEVIKSYEKAYYIGTDPKESGVIQGELVAKQWRSNPDLDLNKDGKISFVILKGEPGHPDAEARTEWIVKTLNSQGIETILLHLDTAMWDTAQAKDKMEAWISGPNRDKIEVVVANNDAMAFGAIEALKAAGKSNIPVFGIDAIPEALIKIKSGELSGTALNDGKNQAKAVVEISENLAKGNEPTQGTGWKFNDEKYLRMPYVAVDKENVTDFE